MQGVVLKEMEERISVCLAELVGSSNSLLLILWKKLFKN